MYIYIYMCVFYQVSHLSGNLQDLVEWPGVPTIKFPPTRPLVQAAVADKGDETPWCAACGPRCPLFHLPAEGGFGPGARNVCLGTLH